MLLKSTKVSPKSPSLSSFCPFCPKNAIEKFSFVFSYLSYSVLKCLIFRFELLIIRVHDSGSHKKRPLELKMRITYGHPMQKHGSAPPAARILAAAAEPSVLTAGIAILLLACVLRNQYHRFERMRLLLSVKQAHCV